MSGTNDSSAKYAIIAARCVPRSAKNFANSARFLTRNGRSIVRAVDDDELRRALSEHAYLEGDFVLRSGRRSRYYLDKYRFETRPDLLRALGERLAAQVREHEPEAARIAGPELGAVALAAAASLESGLPFLIVRKDAKDYGTANRLEGVFEPGERVCLVEDVVTSGGAAALGRPGAPRCGPRVQHRDLRRRPRGGGRGRARAARRPPPAPVHRL